MIDPKSLFQPHMPLETRPGFSRLCHWKRLFVVPYDKLGLGLDEYEVISEKISSRLAQRPGSYVILK